MPKKKKVCDGPDRTGPEVVLSQLHDVLPFDLILSL